MQSCKSIDLLGDMDNLDDCSCISDQHNQLADCASNSDCNVAGHSSMDDGEWQLAATSDRDRSRASFLRYLVDNKSH
jgi:hypothetical protein